jgi:hypothetical protein
MSSKSVHEDLEAWIRSGGRLIAIGGSAAALCSETSALSRAPAHRRARDLEGYRFAAQRERGGNAIAIDEEALWNAPKKPRGEPNANDKKRTTRRAPKKDVDPDAKRQEGWMQRSLRSGAFLRGLRAHRSVDHQPAPATSCRSSSTARPRLWSRSSSH